MCFEYINSLPRSLCVSPIPFQHTQLCPPLIIFQSSLIPICVFQICLPVWPSQENEQSTKDFASMKIDSLLPETTNCQQLLSLREFTQIFPLHVETLLELRFDSYSYCLNCCEFICRSVQLDQKQVFCWFSFLLLLVCLFYGLMLPLSL